VLSGVLVSASLKLLLQLLRECVQPGGFVLLGVAVRQPRL